MESRSMSDPYNDNSTDCAPSQSRIFREINKLPITMAIERDLPSAALSEE